MQVRASFLCYRGDTHSRKLYKKLVLELAPNRMQMYSVQVFLMVQWLGVGLVIERSLVRLPAGALSSQLGELSLLSLCGR